MFFAGRSRSRFGYQLPRTSGRGFREIKKWEGFSPLISACKGLKPSQTYLTISPRPEVRGNSLQSLTKRHLFVFPFLKSLFHYPSVFFLAILLFLSSCEGFFGKKTNVDFVDVPIYTNKPVAYVPVQPVWNGFINPVDVIAGFDELVYVADAGSQEIISFDQAGNELGRFSIPGITSLSQDRSLDLLAIGTFDTLGYSLATVYRIELKNTVYGLNSAHIENKIIHPFYYRVNPPNNATEASVRFKGIGIKADNSFFLTRSGPNSSSAEGPDDAVLLFRADDSFVTPISIQTATGIFSDYFKNPASIVTQAMPPQSPFVNTSSDFIISLLDNGVTLRVQYISVLETDGGITYSVKTLGTGDTAKAERFLYEPYRFASPEDVTVSGDGTGLLFIVDSEKDSLYQFNVNGYEGVKPPAGSTGSGKYILTSFGGNGAGLSQFNHPSGVAYLNRVVYVADAGNARVLRFKLTTDFD